MASGAVSFQHILGSDPVSAQHVGASRDRLKMPRIDATTMFTTPTADTGRPVMAQVVKRQVARNRPSQQLVGDTVSETAMTIPPEPAIPQTGFQVQGAGPDPTRSEIEAMGLYRTVLIDVLK